MMVYERARTVMAVVGAVLLLLGVTACAHPKKKVRLPLPLEYGAPSQAVSLNEQGTQAFLARDFDAAKKYFADTVAAAPQSGPAHYNYGLALNVLGETEAARKQFIEAANLAPGDKVIWDSPALSPFGDPEPEEKAKSAVPQSPNRRGVGGRMP